MGTKIAGTGMVLSVFLILLTKWVGMSIPDPCFAWKAFIIISLICAVLAIPIGFILSIWGK